MKLSNQAMGAIMMALQKSLMEQSDITETLKGFNFRTLASLYNNNTIMEYTTLAPGTNIVPDGQPGAGSVDILKTCQQFYIMR